MFSEEEIKKFNLVQSEGNISWNKIGEEASKDFDISDSTETIIKSTLKKADSENKLTEYQYSLYEKFMEVKLDGHD